MPTERECELLEAIDHIGPVSLYALSYHAVTDEFDSRDELETSIEALADDGYLQRRTMPDVTGDTVIEYDSA